MKPTPIELRLIGSDAQNEAVQSVLSALPGASRLRPRVWVLPERLPVQWFDTLEAQLGAFDYAQLASGTHLGQFRLQNGARVDESHHWRLPVKVPVAWPPRSTVPFMVSPESTVPT